ncbi:MAG TPA: type II secretion system F family protein [Candidatus Paceibacterota bacterium]|jgi:type IV pilus assembly protein PilC|nr:type II secretion system F family protein [Candidatus Paceibacterota bacterium]HQO70704.1 type II secretion system F family protein [Candidatus Paceibacterota bacterium]
MLFNYEAFTNSGEKKTGAVEANSKDLAIAAIQRRGLIVSTITESEKKAFFKKDLFEKKKIPMKDIVTMSRQMSTLFESQIPALKAFLLLSENTPNKKLAGILAEVADDIKGGTYISAALSKHKEAFSEFYVNMIKSGEESGKLTQTFSYLADYLDRQYQLTSKTKNALIYPSFVIGVFVIVMVLMFTFIVPKLSDIIAESGTEVPFFTKIIMGASQIFVNYGLYMLALVVVLVILLLRYARTEKGKMYFDRLKISFPIIKNIYQKLYLSRIADNMDTMLSSSIPIVRAIELTSSVVGNIIYRDILKEITESVKTGNSLSASFGMHEEIPSIMSGMIKVGEETGSLGNILKTLGSFYGREVNEAVDSMVSLIEPIMIIALGLGVGVLLASVLMPIYNIAGGIS